MYQNHQTRQPVNSTELTQNSDPLNRTILPLPNVNTPLPRLNRQNSVHFNTQPVFLNNSNQPTQGPNQNLQITPQQLVNIIRQLNSQNTQQLQMHRLRIIYKRLLHKRHHLLFVGMHQ